MEIQQYFPYSTILKRVKKKALVNPPVSPGTNAPAGSVSDLLMPK